MINLMCAFKILKILSAQNKNNYAKNLFSEIIVQKFGGSSIAQSLTRKNLNPVCTGS